MKDTELYAALLGLRPPWVIREVRLDLAADRVDVWMEEDVFKIGLRRMKDSPMKFQEALSCLDIFDGGPGSLIPK